MSVNTRSRKWIAAGVLLITLSCGFGLGEKAGKAEAQHVPTASEVARLAKTEEGVASLGLSCWLEWNDVQHGHEVICQSQADKATQNANALAR